jgi:thioredoxin-related protein
MKKIVVLIFLLMTSLFADVKWYEYDDAVDLQAKNSSKILMVMITQNGCPACAYMEDVVFKDTKIQKTMQKDFIAVNVNISNDFAPEGMMYVGTPTFYFMRADGTKITNFRGASNSKDFQSILEDIKAKR